jgi:hypothetical protein
MGRLSVQAGVNYTRMYGVISTDGVCRYWRERVPAAAAKEVPLHSLSPRSARDIGVWAVDSIFCLLCLPTWRPTKGMQVPIGESHGVEVVSHEDVLVAVVHQMTRRVHVDDILNFICTLVDLCR